MFELITSDLVSVLTAVVTIASAITAITPTPKDNIFLMAIYDVIEALALVVGKAKDK